MLRRSIVVLTLAAMMLPACTKSSGEKADPGGAASAPAKAQGGKGNRTQPVSTTRTQVETVPLTLEAQGNVLALDEVDIRPQKNGMITQIHFKEGDELKRGQLMFTLDSRDDEANVNKAAAAVSSAEASLSIAQRDLKRNQELSDKNFISPSALDSFRNKVDSAAANLAQNKAALEQAKVSQSYTHIYAPFEGRAGVISVRPGSLVTSTASSPALVHLTRMNPIGVTFSIAERDMPPLLEAMRKGPVKLSALTTGQARLKGEVIFIDSTVDRTAGTLLIKARLDNSSRLVWPGQYVTIQLDAGEIPNAVTLPAQAVVNGPSGRFVYVVQDDQTVRPQPVELVRIAQQKAVLTGIGSDVKVVLEGAQNLRPGSKVAESKADGGGGKHDGKGKHGSAASAPAAAGADK